MRRIRYLAAWLSFFAAALQAQVGVVQNAATPQPSASFNYRLGGPVGSPYVLSSTWFTPGSFVLTPPNIVSPRMLAVLSYPTANVDPFNVLLLAPPATATLSIRPAGSVSPIPVSVTNLVAGAITFVVPAGLPLGGAELLYKIDDQPTQWTSLNVVQSSFAFFGAQPAGPAITQTIAASGTVSSVGLTTPIQPGQTLVLTGSGLGYGSTVSATIGGIPAPVNYAGPHPTQAGHDQILIPIPAGVSDGCYVPVSFTWNHNTLTTTISKTSDGLPCKHPWQLSIDDMKTLDSGGGLSDAAIGLSTEFDAVTAAAASRNESAYMNLGSIDAAGIAGYFAPSPAPSGPNCTAVTPIAAVLVSGFLGGDFAAVPPPVPDLGPSVTLQSPGGLLTLAGDQGYYSWRPAAPVEGSLSNPPAPAIPGGKWTWQSSGGKDLAASSFGFTLPAPIQLSGGAPVILKRTQDQTITWNTSGLDPAATVGLYLSGSAGASVACTAPATTGSVTIPATLLSGIPANSVASLRMTLNQPGSSMPHAILKLQNSLLQNGRSLLLFVSYTSADSRPVIVQ